MQIRLRPSARPPVRAPTRCRGRRWGESALAPYIRTPALPAGPLTTPTVAEANDISKSPVEHVTAGVVLARD